MKEKLLSLIVPVYNTAPYLPRCLGSVLDPAVCGAIEVIAVNDGSTDASPAILRDWARRWPDTLSVIDRPNGGHGAAVNTGLRAASGRYVRVLDSDDWLDTPGFINYVNQLCGCREDLIVTPYTQECCAEGRELRHDYPFLEDGRVYTLDEIDWREGMDYFCLASSAWRTELLRGCGLTLPERTYANNRLKYPLKRKEGTERGAGEWERITWEEAIDEVCTKWKNLQAQYGKGAVAVSFASGNYGLAFGQYLGLGYPYRFANAIDATDVVHLYDGASGEFGTRLGPPWVLALTCWRKPRPFSAGARIPQSVTCTCGTSWPMHWKQARS